MGELGRIVVKAKKPYELHIRLRPKLEDRLRRAAEKGYRSLQQEATRRLEASLAEEGAEENAE
jgi:hypothetical protein